MAKLGIFSKRKLFSVGTGIGNGSGADFVRRGGFQVKTGKVWRPLGYGRLLGTFWKKVTSNI